MFAIFSPSLLLHPFWFSPTETPLPTAPALSTGTATRASTVYERHKNRSNRTAQCGSPLTSADLPSIRRGTGLCLTWYWQHVLLHQTPARLLMGHNVFHFLGPQDARKHLQSGGSQCVSPAVARVSHGVRLHPRVPQGQRQQKCRFSVPLPRACHGTRPHWV